MTEENTDFQLPKDSENWLPAQFWELDPMQQSEALCKIVLNVNWLNKTVAVETRYKTNSTPGELYNLKETDFKLPEDTDFSEFPEFFKEEIRHHILLLAAGYSYGWDGSNFRGQFSEDVRFWDLDQVLQGPRVPTHELRWYTSLLDSVDGNISQICEFLEGAGLNLMTANFQDPEVLQKAVEAVTQGEGLEYRLLEVDVGKELKELQEQIQADRVE